MFTEFMKEFLQIVLAKIKEQTFSVILLLIAVGALTWAFLQHRNENREITKELRSEIRAINTDLLECNKSRAALEVKVSFLEDLINQIKSKKK